MRNIITEKQIENFGAYLFTNEKSKATVKKYVNEISRLSQYLKNEELSKNKILEYRSFLQDIYKPQTVNVKLSAINAFLDSMGLNQYRVKFLRIQRNSFLEEDRELQYDEYICLLETAKKEHKDRLYYMLLTICGTGIRVSELKYITVAAVEKGRVDINMKGKNRVVLLTKELQVKLAEFIKKEQIIEGGLFVTKNGNPVDRSNICHDMKKLCKTADVKIEKVYPHNLRHLFARRFYAVENNLSHLADVLGHSSIETTRIYVAESASSYEKILVEMQMII